MASPPPPTTTTPPETSPLRVGAWVLYDLANTVYAATLTFVFTPFAVEALGNRSALGVANFASMTAAGLCVPLLGALVDRTARTRGYLALATGLCIAALAGWYLDLGPWWLIGCFAVANLTYNVALVFYNALLPSVAPPDRVGRVSGLGVGLGYFGTILVLLLLRFTAVDDRPFFLLAAALFLVLALPCMLLVRDRRPVPPPTDGAGASLRAAARRMVAALAELPRHPPLFWFLLGNFCLVDVLNTAVLFFIDFTVAVFQAQASAGELSLLGHVFPADDRLESFKILAGFTLNVLALVYGIAIGGWTDRSPLRVMRASAFALLAALVGGAAFGGHSALGYFATLVALGAFGLTGIWTAGRKVIVLLAPPERIGEYFGLYGITVKLSVVGGVVYGVVADRFGVKAGMLAQSAQLLLGLGCLLMVRLPPTPPAPQR